MKLHTREFNIQTRATTGDGSRSVSGLAVPYEEEIQLFEGYFETVAAGAVRVPAEDRTSMKLLWRHDEPIGLITDHDSTDDGFMITAVISATPRGDEAYQLVRDGVIDRFSIGFVVIAQEEHVDDDGALHVRLTEIEVREVSLVPFPAYDHAAVTDVRHSTTRTIKEQPMTTTAPAPDLTELRADITELRADITELRQAAAFSAATPASSPAPDTRSAGQVLKALVAGDENTRTVYEDTIKRAWSGTTTTADGTIGTATWVGDLTRLYTQPDQLRGLFSTAPLPAEGMNLEYTELKTNTIKVNEQTSEGADLTLGKIETQDKTTAIKTYGGYTSLSRQAIERTRVNILDKHLAGMTLAAGEASAAALATAFATAVKARASSALSIAKAANALTWGDLAGLIVDAASAFLDQALDLDGLIVDKDTFKALAALTGSDGRPLMSVSGTGANTTGTMNLPGLSGSLVGVTITPNLRQKANDLGTGVVGAFYNKAAITVYESGLVQLQDENVVNLTKAFSVYRYAAVAPELPNALVPLKIGA